MVSTAYANYDAAHIRRSPEAVLAARALVLDGGLNDEEVLARVAEVVRLTLRIAALTGSFDVHDLAFEFAKKHTMTERERSGG